MSTMTVLDWLLNYWPTPFVIAMVVIGAAYALAWTFIENPLEPDTEIEALVEPKRFVGGLDVADRMKAIIDQQNAEQEQEMFTRVRVRCTSDVSVPHGTRRE